MLTGFGKGFTAAAADWFPPNFNVTVTGILSSLDNQTNVDRFTLAPSWKLSLIHI